MTGKPELFAVRFDDFWSICSKAPASSYGLGGEEDLVWCEQESTAYRGDVGKEDEVIPLTTAPAVTVKPLEWRKEGHLDHVADCVLGRYRVWDGFFRAPDAGAGRPCPVGEETASAQADYERRILSALSPQPPQVTPEQAARVLLEDKKTILRMADLLHNKSSGLKGALRAIAGGEG